MGLAMSDEKITLDLGLVLDGDGDNANKDQNEANQLDSAGELTLDLSSTVSGDDAKVSSSSPAAGSGNTAPEALSADIGTLNLDGNGEEAAEADPAQLELSGSSEEGGDFVQVNLEELPEQPVDDEMPQSEAEYWDGATDLFTGITNAGESSINITQSKLSGLDEQKKKVIGLGIVVALLFGVVLLDPTILDPLLGGSDDEFMEDELGLVEESDDSGEVGFDDLEDDELGGDLDQAVVDSEEDEVMEMDAGDSSEESFDGATEDDADDPSVAMDDQGQDKSPSSNQEVAWEENPYWALPNHFGEAVDKPIETWTVEQEEAWRENLNSKFIWQKYKVLEEIKDLKLAGSEVLLWDLTRGKKLWLRVKALMALADFGEIVSIKDVYDAIVDERSSTIARFVKRFKKDPSVGELFVLRQMIRVLDERGRREVLRVIAKNNDKYSDLYLTAGTYDPDERVSRWANKAAGNMSEDQYLLLSNVVMGKQEFTDDLKAKQADELDKQKTRENLFGGMVDEEAEAQKKDLERKAKEGDVAAQDLLDGEADEGVLEEVDPEEVMIYD